MGQLAYLVMVWLLDRPDSMQQQQTGARNRFAWARWIATFGIDSLLALAGPASGGAVVGYSKL